MCPAGKFIESFKRTIDVIGLWRSAQKQYKGVAEVADLEISGMRQGEK
jgi:hypothetical protein